MLLFIISVFAFFMIFGGDKIAYQSSGTANAENATVAGYETFNNALFSIFRLTMVDDYDFDVSYIYCLNIHVCDEDIHTSDNKLGWNCKNVKQIIREIKNFANVDEVKVLKRYLDFWQPINYITKEEAEKLVKEAIEENRKI